MKKKLNKETLFDIPPSKQKKKIRGIFLTKPPDIGPYSLRIVHLNPQGILQGVSQHFFHPDDKQEVYNSLLASLSESNEDSAIQLLRLFGGFLYHPEVIRQILEWHYTIRLKYKAPILITDDEVKHAQKQLYKVYKTLTSYKKGKGRAKSGYRLEIAYTYAYLSVIYEFIRKLHKSEKLSQDIDKKIETLRTILRKINQLIILDAHFGGNFILPNLFENINNIDENLFQQIIGTEEKRTPSEQAINDIKEGYKGKKFFPECERVIKNIIRDYRNIVQETKSKIKHFIKMSYEN